MAKVHRAYRYSWWQSRFRHNRMFGHEAVASQQSTAGNFINLDWLESDHNDPLELVKLFYPHNLPKGVVRDVDVEKMQRDEAVLDLDMYFDRTEGIAYGDARYRMDTVFQEALQSA